MDEHSNLVRRIICSGYHWLRDWTIQVTAECAWAITELELSRCYYLTGTGFFRLVTLILKLDLHDRYRRYFSGSLWQTIQYRYG